MDNEEGEGTYDNVEENQESAKDMREEHQEIIQKETDIKGRSKKNL